MRRTIAGACAAAAHGAFALSAHAQDAHGGGHGADVAHDAAEAAHASPNLFSVEPGLLIWTIITFVVVLVVLRLVAWKPLIESLAERQRNIEGAIAEAKQVKAEADALLARYESTMASAKDEARSILDEARRDGAKAQEAIRETARAEAEEFKERAHREIELQKDAAKQEIWELAGTLSTELAGRILGRTMTAADQDGLVTELVEELRRETEAGSA
ncbi:F0F1 ATP synthase subunit B [bacterium]|nr:F0F1 ATP synthase subunit B [bacterium]